MLRVREGIAVKGQREEMTIASVKGLFDPNADRFTLLKLLNEDLYTGGLSGERFEIDRNSPRT